MIDEERLRLDLEPLPADRLQRVEARGGFLVWAERQPCDFMSQEAQAARWNANMAGKPVGGTRYLKGRTSIMMDDGTKMDISIYQTLCALQRIAKPDSLQAVNADYALYKFLHTTEMPGD